MTPLEKTEALFFELTRGYGQGYDREMRAATKLLLVALDMIKEYGGPHWQGAVYEYIQLLANDAERFRKILEAQRGATRGRGGRPPH
jgi:hypothetical protein